MGSHRELVQSILGHISIASASPSDVRLALGYMWWMREGEGSPVAPEAADEVQETVHE